MANIVLCNGGKVKLLQKKVPFLNTLTLRLFKNPIVLTGATTDAMITELTDTGYHPAVAPPPNTNVGFAAAFLNAANQGETDAPAVTYTFSNNPGNETVQGYYFTDPADGNKWVFGQNAPGPFTISAPGQTYTVVPSMVEDTY
jgi:hypothetical protein